MAADRAALHVVALLCAQAAVRMYDALSACPYRTQPSAFTHRQLKASAQADREVEVNMLWLILGVILLVVAIAGGAIVHPVLFVLGLVALFMFFSGWRGRTASY